MTLYFFLHIFVFVCIILRYTNKKKAFKPTDNVVFECTLIVIHYLKKQTKNGVYFGNLKTFFNFIKMHIELF